MDISILESMWERFVETGELDPRMNPIVAKSWEKCRKHGLDPMGGLGKYADEAVFRSILAENKDLLDTALPVMQSVYEIVEQSHFLLVLTDSVGYVLETIGDMDIQKKSNDLQFLKGSLWSDLEVGSNAIGMALDYDTAIQTVGPEHYGRLHHNWTCSAAPIHGASGEVIGCLDLSGDVHSAHLHTLGLVVAAAFSIETMLIRLQSTRLMREALNGSEGSVVLLDDEFHPIWINKAAEKFLGLSINELENADFREMLPDVDWGQLQQWNQKGQYITNDTRLTTGKCIYDCSAVITPTLDANRRTFTVNLKQQEHLIASVNKVSGNRANYTFSSIYAQDPQMKKVVQLAQKYAHYDGAVLIEGESGTGKELFAQAIHNESSRAKGPFVAVNCASLPRDLIESELFGYEKGAFTGALREGNPGKFELANHGTLFLDEIGEMPLEFQAKLLRAVESLRIRRLGGTQERKLDLRVIAATNRNLRHEAEQGRFRQDLYYRLNVLKLDIPPLRERPLDIGFCAKAFLERFNQKYPEQRKEMSPDYLDALQQYDWPGNVRELQNSMERTFYACNTDVLTADDFRFVITGMTVSDKKENCGQKNKREEILAVLRSAEGRAEVAAQKLGISRATFYRMCKRYGIEPKKVK
ncbi:sigma-54-dependent Fis family transcriptional regulator [Dysosmobacter welbionis]|jgi:transcriptional regulator of acetoin/glycerol metabolism|uniref:sigma-54-dependent Fis family transcriptional regulator n=1 Tax=Dysosmobacter welbionis TaxID=2093857 RepID=UPI003A8E1782